MPLFPVPEMNILRWISLTRHYAGLAVEALGGILIGVAINAQQQLILGSKWFLYQRASAFGTLETNFMPVAVFVGKILKDKYIKTLMHK